ISSFKGTLPSMSRLMVQTEPDEQLYATLSSPEEPVFSGSLLVTRADGINGDRPRKNTTGRCVRSDTWQYFHNRACVTRRANCNYLQSASTLRVLKLVNRQ